LIAAVHKRNTEKFYITFTVVNPPVKRRASCGSQMRTSTGPQRGSRRRWSGTNRGRRPHTRQTTRREGHPPPPRHGFFEPAAGSEHQRKAGSRWLPDSPNERLSQVLSRRMLTLLPASAAEAPNKGGQS